MINKGYRFCRRLKKVFFHLLWKILLYNALTKFIWQKTVFYDWPKLHNIQISFLQHEIKELTFCRITIRLFKNFNDTFLSITIHVMIILHNPTV